MDANELIRSAKQLLQTGRSDEAFDACKQAACLDPDHLEAHLFAGMLSSKSGEHKRATSFLSRAVQLAPQRTDVRLTLANCAFAARDLNLAIEHAQFVHSHDSRNLTALMILARALLSKGETDRALDCLSAVEGIQPGLQILPFLKGEAMALQGREAEAELQFVRAVQMAPLEPDPHISLGNLYVRMDRRKEAITSFRRAYELEPTTSKGLMQLARALMEEGAPDEAERALRQAIGLDPNYPILHTLLGQVHQQLGRFEEAAQCFQRSIDLQPTLCRNYNFLVRCQRITDSDQPLIETMDRLTKDDSLPSIELAHLHYALGKAFDDLSKYEQAFEHFDQANRRMLEMASPFSPKRHSERIDNQIAAYWRFDVPPASDSELPLLIVGMIRSGTTLTEQILSCHPKVRSGGELQFWSDLSREDEFDIGRNRAHTAESYMSLLQSISDGAPRVIDKMPLNFMSLGIVHSLFPNARIVHVRRHPLDTCLSMFVTPYGRPINFGHSLPAIAFFYREYVRLVEHWRSVLPSDRFFEIDYERIVQDREGAARDLVDFAGLDWDEACLHPERNRRAIQTPSLWQARQPLYKSSIGRWKNYQPWIEPLIAALEGPAGTPQVPQFLPSGLVTLGDFQPEAASKSSRGAAGSNRGVLR